MTYRHYGFIEVNALIDNTAGEVAAVGELSEKARTFALEKGENALTTYPGVSLTTFKSITDDVEGVIDDTHAAMALDIAQYLVTQAWSGQVTSSDAHTIQLLNANYGGTYTVTECGTMVSEVSGSQTIYLPTYLIISVDGETDSVLKLWFSDSAFRSQYDFYTCIVIPPVEDINVFMGTDAEVQAALDAYTRSDSINAINTAMGEYPYTQLSSEDYTWKSPNTTDVTQTTNWVVLIYGQAGATTDNVRQAVVDYILENGSAYDRETWKEVFPSIFTATEFMLLPLWTEYAIENATVSAGIYSPTQLLSEMVTKAQAVLDGDVYTTAHLNSYLTICGSLYKSLSFLAVGNPENLDGVYSLKERFSDYAIISTTSSDFGRVSPNTQAWIMLLYTLFAAAETMTEYSTLPSGISRATRNGVPYASFTYDDVTYLMTAKYHYNA